MTRRWRARHSPVTALAFGTVFVTSVYLAAAEPPASTTIQPSASPLPIHSLPAPVSSIETVPAEPLSFSGDRAYAHVVNQVALGPRPVGSAAGRRAGELIVEQLRKYQWQVDTESFVFRGVKGRNIIARKGRGHVVMLGAHYDTRPAADREYDAQKRRTHIVGANDGASGVAVLLEIARVLDVEATQRQLWLVFFDAEDRGGIEDWPYHVGASHMAERLTVKPQAVVIVDMVGDSEQQLYYEKHSDPGLSRSIWKVAERLGYGDVIIPEVRHALTNDHIPFLDAGIPAVNMIDFDYPHWHTTRDTPDKLSPKSLERVGTTLVTWLYSLEQEAIPGEQDPPTRVTATSR